MEDLRDRTDLAVWAPVVDAHLVTCWTQSSGKEPSLTVMTATVSTLPETNMEAQKGPCTIKTTVPLKRGYMGFHVSLGGCTVQVTVSSVVRKCQLLSVMRIRKAIEFERFLTRPHLS